MIILYYVEDDSSEGDDFQYSQPGSDVLHLLGLDRGVNILQWNEFFFVDVELKILFLQKVHTLGLRIWVVYLYASIRTWTALTSIVTMEDYAFYVCWMPI